MTIDPEIQSAEAALNDDVIAVDAFDKVKAGVTDVKTEAPPAETPKAETPKVETPKVETPQTPEVAEVEPLVPLETKPPVKSGSLEEIVAELGLAPQASVLLKRMSNEARDFTLAELRRAKEASEQVKDLTAKLAEASKAPSKELPASWTEHPQAWLLHPEVTENLQVGKQAESERAYWEEQFIKIRRGEDWVDLAADSEGKLVEKSHQPSAKAELYVKNRMEAAAIAAQQAQTKVNQIAGEFSAKQSQLKSLIKQREDTLFPAYKDPASLAQNKYYNGIQRVLKEMSLDNNALSGMLSKLYVFAMTTAEENKKLRTSSVAPAVSKAAPTSASINQGVDEGKAKGDDVVSIDEFEAVKRRPQPVGFGF